MIEILDNSPRTLSRYYDREAPPFRVTKKTFFALSVVAVLHLGLGLVIAHAYFTLPPAAPEDPQPISINTERYIEPKPVKPPPAKAPVKEAASPPPQQEVAAVAPHDTPLPVTDVETVATLAPTTGAQVGDLAPTPPRAEPPPALPKAPPVITNPTWLSKPTADQVSRLYPARAGDSGIGGKATLLCEIQISGALIACSVIDETPKGYRFGEAAQAMTRYFKLNPRTVDGVSMAGSKVRIPIVFNPG